MPSTTRVAQALLSLSLISTAHAFNTMTYVGCFSSSNGLTEASTFQYQSSGHCQETCVDSNNQAVLGLTAGNDCWCGGQTPPTNSKVDDSKCNMPCTGYGKDSCGGDDFWSVYLTGTETSVGSAGGGSVSSAASSVPTLTSSAAAGSSAQSSAAATTAAQQASVITSVAPGKTVVVTELPSGAAATSTVSSTAGLTNNQKKSGGSSTAGIAIGVVVGVVVIAALAGAGFFFWRRKRQQQAREHKGNDVSDFFAGGRAQIPASKHSAGPDARLDHEAMAQHRMSDGSIADNEDYSRRILQVTNPDDR